MTPNKLDLEKLNNAYKSASTRMFFLDYDGTLSPIRKKPEDATPSVELIKLLSSLSADPHNSIYLISGRDRKFLQSWLGDLHVGLSAEHGAFLKLIDQNDGAEWHDVILGKQMDLQWKEDVLSAFKHFCNEVPNAQVETKEYAITLHFRNCEKVIVTPNKRDLQTQISKLTAQYDTLDVRKGKKSIEARVKGITKGYIIKEILNTCERDEVDFVMCIGDDVTDEDMFVALAHEPQLRNVFTCTVGKKQNSASNAYLDQQSEVLEALHTLNNR